MSQVLFHIMMFKNNIWIKLLPHLPGTSESIHILIQLPLKFVCKGWIHQKLLNQAMTWHQTNGAKKTPLVWTNDHQGHWGTYTLRGPSELTHWGRDKMASIFQMTFSNALSWMKMYKFQLIFHWSLSQGPINNIPALVQIMAWCDKPLSEPMMVTDAYMNHCAAMS